MRGLFFLSLVLTTAASGAVAFDYDTFARRIVDKHLTHLEDALGELPAEYWKLYVLMKESRSSQPSNPDYPRVILTSTDGSFVVAFNGNPDFPGFDRLEMIQVRDGGKRFELRQIRFPDRRNHLREPEFSGSNPKACLSCHQPDPRPNWDEYPSWPGAYGSHEALDPGEKQQYLRFIRLHAGDERYRRLDRSGDSPVAPYTLQTSPPRFVGEPNLIFTKFVSRWNAKRMASLLLSSSQGRDRLTIPAIFFNCPNLSDTALARVARTLGLTAEQARVELTMEPHAWLERLLRRHHIEPEDWSLAFVPHDSNSAQARDYRYFDGIFQMTGLVHFQILQQLAAELPQLAPIAQGFGYYVDSAEFPGEQERAIAERVNQLGMVPYSSAAQACPLLDKLMSS